jgi:hypothetical protein
MSTVSLKIKNASTDYDLKFQSQEDNTPSPMVPLAAPTSSASDLLISWVAMASGTTVNTGSAAIAHVKTNDNIAYITFQNPSPVYFTFTTSVPAYGLIINSNNFNLPTPTNRNLQYAVCVPVFNAKTGLMVGSMNFGINTAANSISANWLQNVHNPPNPTDVFCVCPPNFVYPLDN